MIIQNDENLRILKSLENLIVYGYPSVETITNLIHKRGFIIKDKTIIPINSNKVIEEQMNGFGILCIEDLVS